MLRFNRFRKLMRALADYYTGQTFANLLVSGLKVDGPKTALDLGAGQGALLSEVCRRWPAARLHAAEVDSNGWPALRERFPELTLFRGNGLSSELSRGLRLESRSVDVAVCNPPYLAHPHTDRTNRLLRSAGLKECIKLRRLGSDILFLAQNLHLLRPEGELGIILPETLICGRNYAPFREAMMTNHGIFGVIQLPRLAFSGAEIRTHVVFIRRGGATDDRVPIWRSGYDGIPRDKMEVASHRLVRRMDHGFHAWYAEQPTPQSPTLGELGTEIRRGNLTHIRCRKLGLPTFHTSNFEQDGLIRLATSQIPSEIVTAEMGDILIARVGARCIGRVGRVIAGRTAITDCVYRLRVPSPWQDSAWQALRGTAGQAWLQANAYGVCARSLSKRDLLTFPLECGGNVTVQPPPRHSGWDAGI